MRKPTHEMTYHPDYDRQGVFYCMNAWDQDCPHPTHDEKFDSSEEAYLRMEYRTENQTIPEDFRIWAKRHGQSIR